MDAARIAYASLKTVFSLPFPRKPKLLFLLRLCMDVAVDEMAASHPHSSFTVLMGTVFHSMSSNNTLLVHQVNLVTPFLAQQAHTLLSSIQVNLTLIHLNSRHRCSNLRLMILRELVAVLEMNHISPVFHHHPIQAQVPNMLTVIQTKRTRRKVMHTQIQPLMHPIRLL